MEKNYFKNESPQKDIGFIISILALLPFFIMGAGIDLDTFLQQQDSDNQIPSWYFLLIFSINIAIIISIALIYFYKKIGVILFPLSTLLHFLFHHYFLDTFLYSDTFSLFVFFAIGLVAIIPKWQFFK